MSERRQEASFRQNVPLAWCIRLCSALWRSLAYLGTTVLLGAVASIIAWWLTSPNGAISTKTPLGQLLASWPITLAVGCCLLFVALFTWAVSQWPVPGAAHPLLAAQNRVRMLQRLRRTYDDLLEQSLQGIAWMELGLAQRSGAVQNAATLLLRLPQRAERRLPPGTSITQVYDEAAHELLILGDPGVGKSTLLLHLARQLVAQAEQSDAKPLPILLPLSSWAMTRPVLQDWITEHVAETYDIPQQLARHWVEEERFLLLLDGLDEMEEEARPACIAAVNSYHHAHPGPLVVCSRKAEYEEAAKHYLLSLQSAVVVLPLSYEQVDGYLTQVGRPLEALRRALNKNLALREVACTPLMLGVLMLTYQGSAVRLTSRKEAELLRHVWTDYVQRMAERKGNVDRYSLTRTRAWLHWLAHEMRGHDLTVFYIEHLQPDWLSAEQRSVYTWLGVRIPGMLIGALACLLISLFLSVLSGDPGAATLLRFGLLGGFLGGLFSARTRTPGALSQHRQGRPLSIARRFFQKKSAAISAVIGLACGLSFGLNLHLDPFSVGFLYGFGDWLRDGSIFSVMTSLACLVLLVYERAVSPQFMTAAEDAHPRRRHFLPWARTVHGQRALVTATVFGGGSLLSVGLSNVLDLWPNSGPGSWLIFVWSSALNTALNTALELAFTAALVSLLLEVQAGSIHLTERLRWSMGSLARSLLAPRHLLVTLLLASLTLALIGLGVGLDLVLNGSGEELTIVLRNGLTTALDTGISVGLSTALVYWLLVGSFQGIARERIEDHDRRHFNQGVQRSLRTSGIMGIIGAGAIGVLGTLGMGLSFGLSLGLTQGESGWLSNIVAVSGTFGPSDVLSIVLGEIQEYGLKYGWFLAVGGGLLVCAVSGGLALLRHSVIRLLLCRSGRFPWQATQFLEDARARIFMRRVGGGYGFVHRLVLIYFADLDDGDLPTPTLAQAKPPRNASEHHSYGR